MFENNTLNNNKAMKYLIRCVKSFLKFALLCAAIIGALVLIGAVEGNVEAIFEDGYGSILKITVFFALVSSVYPKFSYITRDIVSDKTWEQARETILEYMKANNYILESESPETATFRIRGFAGRLVKMFEDRITLTKTQSGWSIEGGRKEAFRLSSGLENRLSSGV